MAYRRDDHQLVGRGGLSWTTINGVRRLEMGWALRDHFRGQGYATEIGRAALAYAFVDLGESEVVAFTEWHNLASRAVMERLGMESGGEIVRPGL